MSKKAKLSNNATGAMPTLGKLIRCEPEESFCFIGLIIKVILF